MPKKFITEDDDNEPNGSEFSKYQKKRKKIAHMPEEGYLEEDIIPNRDTASINDFSNMSTSLEDGDGHTHLQLAEDSQEPGATADKTERKKTKKEKKPKAKPPLPKKKGPLDLDKQCGVLILPDNIVCTRSLTCKIHTMGAKRAVEGRSQPFNDLLAAYQKKNTGRAAQGATQQQTDKTQQQRPSPSITIDHLAPTATAPAAATSSSTATNTAAEMDSDEETENVLLAIKQFKPTPLGQKRYYYVRRRRAYFKLRDILFDAITPKLSGSSAGLSTSDAPPAVGSAGNFTYL